MPITFVNYPFLNILVIIVLNIVVKVNNNNNNHMYIMNVISSELLQIIMQSTIDSKIDMVIPTIQRIYKIKELVKSTKNVGELINIRNSNKLYDCSYVLSVLPIQSNE
jgi:hypothetical protein